MYKISNYNFLESTDDEHLLLYNSKTGAFASVPAEMAGKIEKVMGFPNAPDVDAEIKKELISGGFILEESRSEFEEIRSTHVNYKKNKSEMILTLLVSEGCNFRCPYCFIYERRGFNMEAWVYDAVLKLIERNFVPDFKLKINFFGGEPTLAHKQILPFMERLNALAIRKQFKEVNYSMVTNGYLLTREKFEQYLKLGLNSFQITLDGDKGTHDKTRALANGGGTFDTIWGNLSEIQSVPGDWAIAVRSNFLRGMDAEISTLISKFNKQFGEDKRFSIYFRPVYDFKTERDEICSLKSNIFSLNEGIHKQMEYNLKAAQETGELRKEMLLSNPVPTPIPAWCDTEKNNFLVVGADGLVFKCDSYVGSADKASGKMDAQGTITSFKGSYDWEKSVYEEASSKCTKCKLLPLCQGGCPRLRMGVEVACYLDEKTLKTALLKAHIFYQANRNAN